MDSVYLKETKILEMSKEVVWSFEVGTILKWEVVSCRLAFGWVLLVFGDYNMLESWYKVSSEFGMSFASCPIPNTISNMNLVESTDLP